MRDILLTAIVFGALPFVLARPYIGVMLWSWLSYMNPHRLTWTFASSIPFAQITALVLLVSVLFSKEKKTFPVDGLMVTWFLFILWMSITMMFAIHPERGMMAFEQALKIMLMTFVTIMVIRDQRRIDLLIWTICISIGFYSIKGGIFTILTGGKFHVYGPAYSFIKENNALAVATLMIVPLMAYLRSITTRVWLRHGLMGGIFFSCISALGSQSRGALITIAALGMYFWWQSKHKLVSGVAVLVMAVFAFSFMPQSWHERMDTIKNYEQDKSAMSRIDAWTWSVNIASARLTGGGFGAPSAYTYAVYYKPVDVAYVAHSIYFDVLSQHGWPGLAMWLTILGLTWRNCNTVIRTKQVEDPDSPGIMLAKMLKLSMVAYMSGGAFLSLAYFDLPWHIIAVAYLLKHQMNPAFAGQPAPVVAASEPPAGIGMAGPASGSASQRQPDATLGKFQGKGI